jgi:L-ascorbate metabolism protein UlaG (beta-lactamase superfamily)
MGEALGNPAGAVLSMGGKNVSHAGDTGLFIDMQLIGDAWGPLDVALLPIGDNFNMGTDDAVRAAQFLKARVTIPMHDNIFDLVKADLEEFKRKAEAADRRVIVVKPRAAYIVE